MKHITFIRPKLGEGTSADAMTPLAFAIGTVVIILVIELVMLFAGIGR